MCMNMRKANTALMSISIPDMKKKSINTKINRKNLNIRPGDEHFVRYHGEDVRMQPERIVRQKAVTVSDSALFNRKAYYSY